MIDFLIAETPRPAVHDDAARRHRRERDRLYADHAAVCRRESGQAHEGGRERARAACGSASASVCSKTEKVSLRQAPKQLVSKVVEDFNLGKWVAQEAAREKLVMAGYRGQAPYVTFLFFRMVTPIVLLCRRGRLCFRDLAHGAVDRRSRSACASAPPISACRRRCCS